MYGTTLSRAAPEASLPFLAAAADAKKTELSDAIARGADPTVASEQLWWLARLIPHVLADPFDGEIPLPPDALAERSRTATLAGQPCPVDALSTAYVNLACLCLDDTARSAISPRLMETFLWGAARWADTYLMPEDVGGSLHAAVAVASTAASAPAPGSARTLQTNLPARSPSTAAACRSSTRCSASRASR